MIKGLQYYYITVFFLVFFSFFSLSEDYFLSSAFRWGLILAFLMSCIFVFPVFFDVDVVGKIFSVCFFSFCMFLLFAISIFWQEADVYRGFLNAIQFIFTLLIFYSSYAYVRRHGVEGLEWLGRGLLIVVFLLFVYIFYFGGYFFQNSNTLGMVAYLCLCCICFLNKKTWLPACLLCGALIVLSNSRSSLLGMMVFIVSYLFMPFLIRYHLRTIYFYSLSGVGLMAVLFSAGILYPELMEFFNSISREVFEKNLDSGRGVIWGELFFKMQGHEIWGRGGGVLVSDISDFDLSVHNLYLQMYMQVGLVGVFFLFGLIFSLWCVVFKGESAYRARVSASAFAGLMVINCFEVTLFQNNLALSLPFIVLAGMSAGSRCDIKRMDY